MTTSKQKILYIGTTNEASGWGEAARGDIRALAKGFDVVSRPMVYAAGAERSQLEGFNQLESKSTEGVTTVIQYCLPEQWCRYGTMKHIGYVEIESFDLSRSRVVDFFNMVDEIWVPNSDSVSVIKQVYSGPVKYVPHAIDRSTYKNSYKFPNIPEISGTFKFFCASEDVPRKNLEGLISAFWSEFDPTEPVSLILKTHASILSKIEPLKKKMRLYDVDAYQKIVIIHNKLVQEEMLGLYQYCDCYVNASMGESWGLPIVHAIGFNKPVISPSIGGPANLLKNYKNHINLLTTHEWCEGHNPNLGGYQTGSDNWYKPVCNSIKYAMREAYQDKQLNSKHDNPLLAFSEEVFIKNVKENLQRS
jgi:glycosyltransferase involved in cell wall biosynthesis